jgi:hypothetical protein
MADSNTDIEPQLVALAFKFPPLIFLLGWARGSGELWLYLYFTYILKKPKNIPYINTHIGKTTIGLLWSVLAYIAVYWIKFGFVEFDFEKSLTIVLSIVTFSILSQMIITLPIIFWGSFR